MTATFTGYNSRSMGEKVVDILSVSDLLQRKAKIHRSIQPDKYNTSQLEGNKHLSAFHSDPVAFSDANGELLVRVLVHKHFVHLDAWEWEANDVRLAAARRRERLNSSEFA